MLKTQGAFLIVLCSFIFPISGFSQTSIDSLTKKGNKVFILAMDNASVAHAANKINRWGYWQVVEVKSDADFVLKLNLSKIGLTHTDYQANAEFINAKTNEIVKVTSFVNTRYGTDFNTKRGVINKLINKRIIRGTH